MVASASLSQQTVTHAVAFSPNESYPPSSSEATPGAIFLWPLCTGDTKWREGGTAKPGRGGGKAQIKLPQDFSVPATPCFPRWATSWLESSGFDTFDTYVKHSIILIIPVVPTSPLRIWDQVGGRLSAPTFLPAPAAPSDCCNLLAWTFGVLEQLSCSCTVCQLLKQVEIIYYYPDPCTDSPSGSALAQQEGGRDGIKHTWLTYFFLPGLWGGLEAGGDKQGLSNQHYGQRISDVLTLLTASLFQSPAEPVKKLLSPFFFASITPTEYECSLHLAVQVLLCVFPSTSQIKWARLLDLLCITSDPFA